MQMEILVPRRQRRAFYTHSILVHRGIFDVGAKYVAVCLGNLILLLIFVGDIADIV
jgi:hypothetical protein